MKLKKKTFKTIANVKKTTVEQIITRLQQLLIYTINTNIGKCRLNDAWRTEKAKVLTIFRRLSVSSCRILWQLQIEKKASH